MAGHPVALPGRTQRFGNDSCFLCGRDIPPGSALRTVEHVFPKWLLHELGLWDAAVTQINGRLLPYRRLTLPCCRPCNAGDLSGVEARVREAYVGGLERFVELDRRDLFIWLGKIYYGLVYRESLSPREVRDYSGARLIPEKHLESISFHHFLLQAAAGVVGWQPSDPGPASFHFFECLDDSTDGRFDYLDDLFIPLLGIRMGSIGVVCVLQDWGRSEGVTEPHLAAARAMALHPTQFREVFGRLSYMTKASWVNQTHVVLQTDSVATVLSSPPGPFAGEFRTHELAQVLAPIWQVSVDDIWSDGIGMTTLTHPSGAPMAVEGRYVVFPALYGHAYLWPAHTMSWVPASRALHLGPGADS